MQEQQQFLERGRGRLENMIAELERQKDSRVDFVADSSKFHIGYDRQQFLTSHDDQVLEWMTNEPGFTRNGLRQFLAKCEPTFPLQFWDKVYDNNHALELATDLFQTKGKRVLIRMLDGMVRAVLSDQYKVIDSYDVAFHALDTVRSVGGEVIECRLTDREMRIAFTTRNVVGRIKAEQDAADSGDGYGHQASHTFLRASNIQDAWGDWEPPHGSETVLPMITVRNSETGEGGYEVQVGILEAACVNMCMVRKEIAKVHLGRRLGSGVYQDDTREAVSRSILLQTRDVLRKAFEPEWFHKFVAVMQRNAEVPVDNPVSAVENLAATYKISDKRRDAIMQHFIGSKAFNVYSLGRACSRTAQDVDAEDATELERIAGEVMTGNPTLVKTLVTVKS